MSFYSYTCIGDADITIELADAEIYDYKTNMWQTRLKIPSIMASNNITGVTLGYASKVCAITNSFGGNVVFTLYSQLNSASM
jgi:hypothetical protein